MWKDAKYLVAYLLPATTFAGLWMGGKWSIAGFVLAFVMLPLIELILPPSPGNVAVERELGRSKRKFFDVLLYLNVPIVYGLCAFLAYRYTSSDLTGFEMFAMTLSVGVVVGSCGINVGHELGHREHRFDLAIAQLLLVPAFYTHFTIEHNYGHHRNVATPADPATARMGEPVFAFWGRSIYGTLTNAWKLQTVLLKARGVSFWNLVHNTVLRGALLELVYLALMAFIFGIPGMTIAFIAGVIGVLLLESVNYIEHYGLQRKQLNSGRYEPVNPTHSWNSDHEMGRIFLYELTRHSDHHFKSTRKYQILRHMDEAPQLPVGYPASIILALIPPLWMRVMHPRIQRTRG